MCRPSLETKGGLVTLTFPNGLKEKWVMTCLGYDGKGRFYGPLEVVKLGSNGMMSGTPHASLPTPLKNFTEIEVGGKKFNKSTVTPAAIAKAAGDFPIQRTCSASTTRSSSKGYRFKHPRLGWIEVSSTGEARLKYPMRSHFTEGIVPVIKRLATLAGLDFAACVASVAILGFADDAAIGGVAALSKKVRTWAVSEAGKRILFKLGVAGAAIAVLYGIWKCRDKIDETLLGKMAGK